MRQLIAWFVVLAMLANIAAISQELLMVVVGLMIMTTLYAITTGLMRLALGKPRKQKRQIDEEFA